MTLPRWGRVTPTQGDMLMLAGHVLSRRRAEPETAEPDVDRLNAMKGGRERLRRRTGHDCGYDLGQWHVLLLSSETDEWGYRHPYGWGQVRQAIEIALADPDRLRLVRLLEQEPRHLGHFRD